MMIEVREQANTHDFKTMTMLQCVASYRCLGKIIDSKLNFKENCAAVCKKGHQRLHCLKKLSYIQVDKTMMSLF